ncbi:MAG: ABC transporter substrate-binding protein [Muribaculaceae bacterium]|nr:ABC transporter substrate-binding protein [Muribaculaceae bacterium]
MKITRYNLLLVLLCLFGCTDDDSLRDGNDKQWIEKTIAVVLPMEKGLDEHWYRSFGMFAENFERAFKGYDVGIKLRFEYFDESTEDISELAEKIAYNDDYYAVIGGLYSSDAALLASQLTRVGKTLFTVATSEELVRAYAWSGYLWAMTETDITQCEVLLSKVVNYGGNSVALIAKRDDIYGKTFIDWFAFQAKELGLENKGVFAYDEYSLEEMSRQAMQSGAEYVICVPSEIDEIGPMLGSYTIHPRAGEYSAPRLLFSDTGYGTDVLTLYGEKAEGLEGVAFGADPESGFDVSYRTFFGVAPTVGEAQIYDACMLLGYAAWYQYLNPKASLQNSLRTIVLGEDLNMGSWTGEDMGLVIDALAAGNTPFVRGASGQLRFDKKIFTNVLATTYYNYKLYNGQYIFLDYNTSDGGNRTDATLAGWNWKASQAQEFEDSSSIVYSECKGNWALLVATSREWTNYRHQADVLAIYQQLRAAGYPDDRIILIAEDDIAYNPSNIEPGVVRVSLGGVNVYENVSIDYKLSELSSDDFLAILKGESNSRLPEVIDSNESENIFIYWSGHGVPGGMCWDDNDYGITGDQLSDALNDMYNQNRYRKLLMMVEACYSGGVLQQCEGMPGMLFITAANADETSKADVFNAEMRVWMSNRFTSTFIEQITQNRAISMRDIYYRLFINTVGSHVMVYNAVNYGNLYSADMSEFINFVANK